jgi:hypothetical protein
MWPIGKRHVLTVSGFRGRAAPFRIRRGSGHLAMTRESPMKANSPSILTRAASTEDRAGLTMRIT